MEIKTPLLQLLLLLSFVNVYGQSCPAPVSNPTVDFSYITAFSVEGFIIPATPAADGYLVVRRNSATNISSLWPVSGVTYTAGDLALGGQIVENWSTPAFTDSYLSQQTTYYYFVYPYNDCGDGTTAYYTNIPGYVLETANVPACVDEGFEGVEFDYDKNRIKGNGQGECYYVAEPDGWDFSLANNFDAGTCIIEGGGHGAADSNYALIKNSNSYIMSSYATNPTVLEFWGRSMSPPQQQSVIEVQYSYTGANWVSMPFYSVQNGTTQFGEISTTWTRYVLDFTLEEDISGGPLPKGDYQVRWKLEGNPFDFALDDVKFYCQGSDYNCPPKAKWTRNSTNVLGWWETDKNGNLVAGDIAIIPTTDISVTVAEDYDTATYGDFEVCSLLVEAGTTLNINGSASPYNYVAILKQLDVQGTLLVQDKNSVIMVYNSGEVINDGVINVMRTGQPSKSYDYTYWSSPVEDASFDIFTGSDSSYIFKYVTPNFKDLFDNNAGGGTTGDPDNLDDDEPYLDFGHWQNWNPDYDWQRPGESIMTPGEGYIVIAPYGGAANGQEITFSGKINNGVVTNDLYLSSNVQSTDESVYSYDFDDWNLIGNPYPSAIDAAAFLGNPNNIEVIGGTLYRWTHTEEVSFETEGYGGYRNYAKGDYSYFNRAGEVVAYANQERDQLGKIASGQSFMVEVYATGLAGEKVGDVTFINSMRFGAKENEYRIYPANDNSTFYKSSRSKKNTKVGNPGGDDRIWLNLTEKAGAFSQMLVGFFEPSIQNNENATNGIDRAYDGLRLVAGNYLNIYSLVDGRRFAIQGRAPLKNTDVIPVGFVSNIFGTLKISIDHIEGALGNRTIFLEDKLVHKNGTYHNLSKSDYEFTIAKSGEFNDRFNLRFSEVVEEKAEELTSELIIYSPSRNDDIYIKSLNGQKINRVAVYDLLGRELINDDFDSLTYVLRSPTYNEGTILIFNVTLQDGKVYNKKYIVM